MKYLKTYQLFESKIGLTADQEAFLNECTDGTWTYDSATGLVDVKGGFDCADKGLSDFVGIKFGKVGGRFYCDRNYLTSLEGAPQEVGGEFNCSENKLTSLKGAPQEVDGDFGCYENKLTSLKGAPQEVGGTFGCYENKLTSLAGGPQEVGDYFECAYNQLTSLAGAPQEVGLTFGCYRNKLTSLAGAPQKVGKYFKCDAFELEKEEWNPMGWLRVLKKETPEAQKLILTLLSAEVLNKEIQKDPAGMAMKLKEIWNDEVFKKTRAKLVWPKGYDDSADLVGDLNNIGF